MKSGTPGPQFHNDFGDPFMKLGTPTTRSARAGPWATQLPSNYSTAVKRFVRSFRAYFIRGWPAPVYSFISQVQMATSKSPIDVEICSSDNDDGENHKNETTRFTFSQIHKYLQFGTYPSDFQKSDKQALRKRSKFFKSSGGSLYYVGGGMWQH